MTSTTQNATLGTCPPGAGASPPNGTLLVLHAFAQRIDGWLKTRERVATDHDALASMSDRELIDIGLSRASIPFVASGGRVRDYPF